MVLHVTPQAALDAGLLRGLKAVLQREDHKGCCKDAAWAVSNVLAGTRALVRRKEHCGQ